MDSLQELRQEFHAILELDDIDQQFQAVNDLLIELYTPDTFETDEQFMESTDLFYEVNEFRSKLCEEEEKQRQERRELEQRDWEEKTKRVGSRTTKKTRTTRTRELHEQLSLKGSIFATLHHGGT